MTPTVTVFQPAPASRALETAAAWLLGALWILPLAYAVWTAFHPAAFSTRFEIGAPLTLQNFANAWHAAPFARYFLNTTLLVAMVLAGLGSVLLGLTGWAQGPLVGALAGLAVGVVVFVVVLRRRR